MKLALIGGGNMGGALLKALVKSNTLAASDTLLIEPDSGKRENLVRETGCRAKASMDDEIAGADCLLLAVKPQSATDVMPSLKPLLTGNPMLISVMAGVSMQSLEEGLGLKKLVRVMPNTPGANPNAANARVTNNATIKIIMIGSFRFAISLSQKVSTSWVVTAFEPCWFLESRTSCSERPVYVNFMNGLQGLNQITKFC